ncbi:MAG: hypothetical protein FWD63_05670 [Propionibacteriaceae bacterium]|nr:hypothetical protein [Propionibacteriaceae bacterium]
MTTTQQARHKPKWHQHTQQQLHEIPQLAHDAWLCRDTPWRPQNPYTSRPKRPNNTPAPTNLDWLDAMDARTGTLAQLATLATKIHHAIPQTNPLPNKETWQNICKYLAENLGKISEERQEKSKKKIETTHDIWLEQQTRTTINTAWTTLNHLVGDVVEHLTTRCLQCNLPIKPDNSNPDTWICPAGHRYSLTRQLAQLSEATTITTTQACTIFGCTPRQLTNWRRRRYITPAGTQSGQHTWHPTDIQQATTRRQHQPLDTQILEP